MWRPEPAWLSSLPGWRLARCWWSSAAAGAACCCRGAWRASSEPAAWAAAGSSPEPTLPGDSPHAKAPGESPAHGVDRPSPWDRQGFPSDCCWEAAFCCSSCGAKRGGGGVGASLVGIPISKDTPAATVIARI